VTEPFDAARRERVLSESPVFEHVPAEARRIVAELMHVERFDRGEVVCEPGDPAHGVLVLASGALEVSVGGRPVRTLRPGDVLGEYGMFGDGVRTARVVALEESVAFSLDYGPFVEVLRAHPDAMLALWRITVDRLLERERG
jgi:CRP-like cAMP-binding protein